MKTIKEEYLSGERALFKSKGVKIQQCVFADGESPLKGSSQLEISHSVFKWKYPLWYCKDVVMNEVTLVESARSGIWYTHNLHMENSTIQAPKTFRQSSQITLKNVDMPNALESFWNCRNIDLQNVSVNGDYFGMNSEHIILENVRLTGNYCFDGAKDMEVHHARLLSKDAFWNCEHITVYDSVIIGEYIGWNSKHITFVNCTIESLQGLCYIENLTLKNCKLINTSLAFEYSTVEADIDSSIDSILNPISGNIKAHSIKNIILDEEDINPNHTHIIVQNTQHPTEIA